MKQYFDAIIVVPLEEEFSIAVDQLVYREDLTRPSQIRFSVGLGDHGHDYLLVKQNTMGRTATEEAFNLALRDYDAGVLVCAGIAGGLSTDLAIGDVCYTGRLIDVTDNAKITDVDGSTGLALSSLTYSTPTELALSLNLCRVNPAMKSVYEAWQERQYAFASSLIPGSFSGKGKKIESIRKPSARDGAIACGSVSGSDNYNRSLKGADRKVLAIETESGGMFAVAALAQLPAIAIRGISDYADADKNAFEHDTAGKGREIAAANAFSFIAEHFATNKVQTYLTRRRAERTGTGTLILPGAYADEDIIARSVLQQSETIEAQLRILSPNYSAQAKGYKLPVPRVRAREAKVAELADNDSDPMEIAEAIRLSRVVVLDVPKEYPDKSLSWAVGHSLLSTQIEGRQVIPIVIAASTIQVPKSGISTAAGNSFSALSQDRTARVVVIVDDFNFDSKTRVDFFLKEVLNYPDVSFIVITRSRSHIVNESRFAENVAALTASICDISFLEMSFFLRNNFEMSGPASEVIATRLRDTFRRFHLLSHPTYFAGIPPSVLHALLEANRRAELIEIAVVGYLSFVVSRDEEPITLSRTTRERFLSELALERRLNQVDFTEAELVAFADKIAKQYDFRISPARFISDFVTKGILHFADDKVQFTLPFIESFLLAKRAAADDEVAAKIFPLVGQGFDYPTFTLYAEMGVSPRFHAELIEQLDESRDHLTKHNENILLTDQIRPVMLSKQERVQSIRKRLERAVDDVRSDSDKLHEKQRLLDASDQVKERVARERASKSEKKASTEPADRTSKNTHALTMWMIAVSLLGAGAERMKKEPKRELVGKILRLSTLIIEDWTRFQHSIDYYALKKDLKASDELIRNISKSGSAEDLADARTTLDGIFDLVEFVSLIQPFQRITAILCEEARDRVLAESIIQTNVDGRFDNLLKGIWLADVDTIRGKELLKEVLEELPTAPFLRLCLASHLIARVYWRHWKREDRLVLLEAANEVLKKIGRNYNKGEIERLIKREESDPGVKSDD